jgi:hypothetical protein
MALLIGGAVVLAKGCAGHGLLASALSRSGLPSQARPSKEQWRNRLRESHLDFRIGLHGSPANYTDYGGTCNTSDFVARMGRPDRTQTVGEQAFWYYDCKDGVIQMSLSAYELDQGIVIANHINDY